MCAHEPLPISLRPFPQVVWVEAGASEEAIKLKASKAKALHIRGSEVVKWAIMLEYKYRDYPDMPKLDDAHLRALGLVDGVLSALLGTAVAASLPAEVTALHNAHMQHRSGYANTRYGSAEDPGSQPPPAGAAGADVPVVDPGLASQQRQPPAPAPPQPQPPVRIGTLDEEGFVIEEGGVSAMDTDQLPQQQQNQQQHQQQQQHQDQPLPTPAPAAPSGQPPRPQPPVRVAIPDAEGGPMDGLDDVEIEVSTVPRYDTLIRDADAAAAANSAASFLMNECLVSHTAPEALRDYSPTFFMEVATVSFPNGVGGIPQGMSLDKYARLLARRWPPVFATDNWFQCVMFDVRQRHAVYRSSWVQTRVTPDVVERVGMITPAELEALQEVLCSKARGKARSDLLAAAPPIVKEVLKLIRMAEYRVQGSKSQCLRLRSQSMGLWDLKGPFTLFWTINPSELNAGVAFELAGKLVTYDLVTGEPTNRPAYSECWSLICNAPVACADFFHCFMRAFHKAFLGWNIDTGVQGDPNCMFGVVTGAYYNVETSTRGALHAHGQVRRARIQSVVVCAHGHRHTLACSLACKSAVLCGAIVQQWIMCRERSRPFLLVLDEACA